ncbi:MAG: transcriptional repressor [Deltaproteobacteria bacterium]|nr:MAG: transcriptional repressor [Deltaproteobacteria bacterium]
MAERLAAYMKQHRLKETRQRKVIFEIFTECEDHVAVDELLARVQAVMPGIGYTTVYRTLKLFTEAGIAHERRFQDGQTRYEPVEAGEHHDHLICLTCGHIFEFEDELIEARQADVAEAHGLRMVSHRHDIYGECLDPEGCVHRREDPGR